MATITVHAGDFHEGKATLSLGAVSLRNDKHPWLGEPISIKQFKTVEVATEESVRSVGGAIGWGAAGGLLLGPVGLLAGLLLGGKKNEVTFVAQLEDGRKMLATTDSKTFTKLRAVTFGK